jgi:hypothetical protein
VADGEKVIVVLALVVSLSLVACVIHNLNLPHLMKKLFHLGTKVYKGIRFHVMRYVTLKWLVKKGNGNIHMEQLME